MAFAKLLKSLISLISLKSFPLSVFRLIAYLCEDMRGIVTILIAFATLVSCGGVRKKSAPPQPPLTASNYR